MNLARLQLLEQYAREDPNDPFPRYALALEWVTSDPEKADGMFASILTDHPGYLPVYYHAAHLKITLGKVPEATLILEKGIQLATASRENKTKAELAALLDGIE